MIRNSVKYLKFSQIVSEILFHTHLPKAAVQKQNHLICQNDFSQLIEIDRDYNTLCVQQNTAFITLLNINYNLKTNLYEQIDK